MAPSIISTPEVPQTKAKEHSSGDPDLPFVDDDTTAPPTFSDKYEERRYLKHRLVLAFRVFAQFGFSEGVAGHITVRDPVNPTSFWVNPFGMHFSLITDDDLIRVDHDGNVVGGKNRRLNYDSCVFYNDHVLYLNFAGVVLAADEGRAISRALGQRKAALLGNHGLLTAGASVEAVVAWFVLLEKCCQVQLAAEASNAGTGTPLVEIGEQEAKTTWETLGAIGFPETASPAARARTEAATRALGQTLVDAAPNVIIAFLDDHFENFFRTNMPSIAVGVAASHSGPADQLMEALRIPKKHVYAGNPPVAEALLRSLVSDGFDAARAGSCEFGQNLLMPWVLMGLEGRLPADVSVVPVYINVFTPPLIRYSRAYALGEAVRRAVDGALPDACRVAFVCTGGLSHWPPYWNPGQAGEEPGDAFLAKMKEYQTFGPSVLRRYPRLFVELDEYEMEMARKNEYPLSSKHPLINEDWDRMFLRRYCAGDSEWLRNLTYEEVEEEAGHGGHEILNYVAVSGAMGGKRAKLLLYEPVLEWICGMAYVDFEVGD
ncbi:hypothetical protein SLS55_002003 [Diplodia seriata]|uniref:Class II aldolase/adducin N-terminal domain-containing protein n=1 Tax=Diplodia seriata TaxID=420778 RepID=A0ABR3CQX9_9PEZI